MRALTCGFLALALCALPVRARAQQTQTQQTVTLAVDAPVYVTPNADQTPLRVGKKGSVLGLVDATNDWVHVIFQDPDYGRRAGYVQRQFVQMPGAPAPQTAAQPPTGNREAAVQLSEPEPLLRKSVSSKFFLGAGLDGAAIESTEPGVPSTTESGAGVSFDVGYGFTPRWALYGTVAVARINSSDLDGSYALGHFDLGARVHFRTGPNTVVPFLQFGLSSRTISLDIGGTSFDATGLGGSFGGGLNVHLTPAFAFSGSVTWSAGHFTDYKLDNIKVPGSSVSANSARFHVGVIWYLQSSSINE